MVMMAGELTAGVLGLIGAAKLYGARSADSTGFQSAKSLAIMGGAVGMIIWYGFFFVLGEAYFNM